MKIVFE